MKYQETYLGSKAEFAEFIKKAVPDLFAGNLAVEGNPVVLPADTELTYKVKYDDDVEGGSVSIKVSWDNPNMELELDM